jgi:hypothetical protein
MSPSDSTSNVLPNPADSGLCSTCLHARRMESDRGSVFLLCELSWTDARFPKYPHLPVLACDGYQTHATTSSE